MWRSKMLPDDFPHDRSQGRKGGDTMYKKILSVLMAVLLIPVLVEARITKIQITIRDTAFGGYSWPGVGQYERIVGTAYAEVDPNDPRNAVIVDLGLAEIQSGPGQPGKNANGKVEYSF